MVRPLGHFAHSNWPLSRRPNSPFFRGYLAFLKTTWKTKRCENIFSNISNCRLTYNDYTRNYSYIYKSLIHCVQSQIWKRQYPKNGGVTKG
jgi:hypothetical protein